MPRIGRSSARIELLRAMLPINMASATFGTFRSCHIFIISSEEEVHPQTRNHYHLHRQNQERQEKGEDRWTLAGKTQDNRDRDGSTKEITSVNNETEPGKPGEKIGCPPEQFAYPHLVSFEHIDGGDLDSSKKNRPIHHQYDKSEQRNDPGSRQAGPFHLWKNPIYRTSELQHERRDRDQQSHNKKRQERRFIDAETVPNDFAKTAPPHQRMACLRWQWRWAEQFRNGFGRGPDAV